MSTDTPSPDTRPLVDRMADALEYAARLHHGNCVPPEGAERSWDALLREHAATVRDAPTPQDGERALVEELLRFASCERLTGGRGGSLVERASVALARVLDERDAARKTNADLHRRTQHAEAAARENVAACEREGISLGRGLANWYGGALKREAEAALARATAAEHAREVMARELQEGEDAWAQAEARATAAEAALDAARARITQASAWLEERAKEIATLTRRLADAEKRPCSHLAGVPEGSTVCWLTGNRVYVPVNPVEGSGHDCDANGCQWGHVECIDLVAVCVGEDYVAPIIRRALASSGPDAGRGGSNG